ncbi:hypothetical protein LAV84_18280 [Rhizobium sp. VS19-DR104.2]|nr:hypothetical protein [Rhizobium sp. VS19-DR104.2]
MVQVELLKGYRRRGVGTTMEVTEGLADGLEAIGLAKRMDAAPEPEQQPEAVEEPTQADAAEQARTVDLVEDESVAEFNRLHPEAEAVK